MTKSFFIDTTLCTACRGCQVACKQWHDLPGVITKNNGTYQNPPDLNFNNYKLVRYSEHEIDGKVNWLFFPDQCRHCVEPPCQDIAGDETAIYTDEKTGSVIYTANTKYLNFDEILESCPYNIPRKGPDGTIAKCDMCNDRVHNGLLPACVQACPTGTMNFGEREEMLELANKRLAEVKKKYPKAMLLDPEEVKVIFLVAHDPNRYHEFAVAKNGAFEMNRHMALRKMFRPLKNITSRLLS